MELTVKAFAKVNPYLKILSRESDGYHQLDLGLLSINLADLIKFREIDSKEIVVKTDAPIPQQENLVFKVARELQNRCGSPRRGAEIVLDKAIPTGAGLGGGSSDAAATLIFLNQLWNCNLEEDELISIGEEFGSDITFFFYGGYCRGRGRGTQIEKTRNPFKDRWIPILVPPFSQTTPQAYRKYDETHPQIDTDAPQTNENVRGGNTDPDQFTITNDLQGPVMKLNPELQSYLSPLEKTRTLQTVGLTGSGSALFGISRRDVSQEEIAGSLDKFPEAAELYLTHPVDRGQQIFRIKW